MAPPPASQPAINNTDDKTRCINRDDFREFMLVLIFLVGRLDCGAVRSDDFLPAFGEIPPGHNLTVDEEVLNREKCVKHARIMSTPHDGLQPGVDVKRALIPEFVRHPYTGFSQVCGDMGPDVGQILEPFDRVMGHTLHFNTKGWKNPLRKASIGARNSG